MLKKFLLSFLFLTLFVLPTSALALVNINTAGLDELDSIPEVGPSTATKIINYRDSNGPFKKIEDLMNVSGIKEATFAKMKDYVTVSVDSSGDQPSVSTSNNSVDTNISSSISANTNSLESSKLAKEDFKINGGRDRLATVRTPIIFSVISNKTGKNINSFQWSFGDGATTFGQKVSHAYQFPGVYNVVINSQIDNGEEAVDRLVVTVLDSKIKITQVDAKQGYVEITNSSDKEQNINNWILKLGPKMTYFFPLDTIISPKSSIKVPLRNLGFDLSSITQIILTYPDGGEASGASLESPTQNKSVKVKEIEEKISLLKKQLADKNLAEPVIAQTKTNDKPDKLEQKTSDVVILENNKSDNFLEKIKNALFK